MGKLTRSLKRKRYEKELSRLQADFPSFRRVVVVFEGRDTAGKGRTIRAMTERVSPRVFHAALLRARHLVAEKFQFLRSRHSRRAGCASLWPIFTCDQHLASYLSMHATI